jgi:ketosteroid isomerase-like protein
MADFAPVIETMEHRWMRAWVKRDVKALKAITASNFILLTGSRPPAILDRPSLLEAVAKRWDCSSYRFGEIVVRREGAVAVFSAPVELKASLDGRDWSGAFSITDVWRKRRVRGWKLVQRVVSRVDEDPQVAKAIKSLQLWK